MRLTGENFWGSPPPAGTFASMSTSAPGLSMANWPSAGPDWTSKTSSASLPEPPLVDVDGTQRRAVTALVDPGSARGWLPRSYIQRTVPVERLDHGAVSPPPLSTPRHGCLQHPFHPPEVLDLGSHVLQVCLCNHANL